MHLATKMLPDSLENIARFLGGESADDILRCEGIPAGVSSQLWHIKTKQNEFVLKKSLEKLSVPDPWYISTRRNRNEYNYLKIFSDKNSSYFPRVFGYEIKKQYFLMEYIDKRYKNWKTELAQNEINPNHAQVTGEILGKIHDFFTKSPAFFELFDDSDLFYQTRLSPYWEALHPYYPELEEKINRVIQLSLTKKITIIHGDVSPKNIMVSSQGVIFLDAECAFWGDPAYDLAFFLVHIFLKCYMVPSYPGFLMKMIEATLRGYLPYVSWETNENFLSRVRFYWLMFLLARVDGKSQVEYLDPMQKQAVRFFALSHLLPASTSYQLPPQYEDINVLWESCFKVFLYQK